jgi:hypothetical protein
MDFLRQKRAKMALGRFYCLARTAWSLVRSPNTAYTDCTDLASLYADITDVALAIGRATSSPQHKTSRPEHGFRSGRFDNAIDYPCTTTTGYRTEDALPSHWL